MFKKHFPYRISSLIPQPELKGKLVSFKGWYAIDQYSDLCAKVKILSLDGTEQDEWIINPFFLLNI